MKIQFDSPVEAHETVTMLAEIAAQIERRQKAAKSKRSWPASTKAMVMGEDQRRLDTVRKLAAAAVAS